MQYDQVLFWRNFFFRLFILSGAIATIIFIVTDLTKSHMMSSLGLSEQEFKRDVMNSAVILRVWLIFVILPLALTFQTLLRRK